MTLSRKAKEAIKTALAVVLAYAIALSMDWDRPYWAGFAVALCSLATYGQSLNKAGMRILGTMVAIPMAFLLLGLFSQQRWGFMAGLSLWMTFCAYRAGGSQHAYFWQFSGFATAVISIAGGPDSANAFAIAMLRAQETGLGLLVYSILASLLWPLRSGDQFRAAVSRLVDSQATLHKTCCGVAREKLPATDTAKLVADMRQAYTQFQTLLEAAETDTYEVWEMRAQWRQFRRQVAALCDGLANWCDSVTDLQRCSLAEVFPELLDSNRLLAQRFSEMLGMLDGRPPLEVPRELQLRVDRDALRALAPFERAEVIVARDRWLELERRTRAMRVHVGEITGFGIRTIEAEPVPTPAQVFALDTDRMLIAARVFMLLWLAYLLWIYVPDLPGGTGVVSLGGPVGLMLASAPQVRVSQAFWPAMIAALAAGLMYIFIMPHLTSFLGLGLLLFAGVFTIFYVFAAPQQALSKLLGTVLFLKVASVSNEQTYDFMVVANTVLMLPVVFFVILVTAYIPFSPLPEKVFMRLLRRYFRSSRHLIGNLWPDPERPSTRRDRARHARHLREIATLPDKLGAWGRFIGADFMPRGSPDAVSKLVSDLQALSFRLQELWQIRNGAYPAALVSPLQANMRAWCEGVDRVLGRWADDPAGFDRRDLHLRLDPPLGDMERRIRAGLAQADRMAASDEEAANFYRLLAAYRGLTGALGVYADSTAAIDWPKWREERFA